MSDLEKAQQMMAAALAAKETEDPEITEVRQLIKLLDKASKNLRTFGPTNPVSQRFFDQFYEVLTGHLGTYQSVSFLVQRSELFFREVSVYGSSTDPSTENLAFRLYADGIRELTFHEGMIREDLSFFLDALWGGSSPSTNDDDDIVTRLWERNLPSLTIVTADEALKLSEADSVLKPQDSQSLNAPPASLYSVAQQERARASADPNKPLKLQAGVTGYEVTPEEAAQLAQEIADESKRDNVIYILDILTAILAAEQSPVTIERLIETFDGLLESLTQQGRWSALEAVLLLLSDTDAIRPDMPDDQKRKLRSLVEKMGSQDRLRLIEEYLNTAEQAATVGLDSILLMMPDSAIPALCVMLSTLNNAGHQAIVADQLTVLAKPQPEPLLRSLTDRRPMLVRNVLSILTKWAIPQHADAVEKALRHPDAGVRKDAVRTFGALRPSGNGLKLIGLLNDGDEAVRLATFKLLLTGNYTAPFLVWEPIIAAEDFNDRPPAEKRNIFQAMRCTVGDEAVPYLAGLLTDWGWTHRKKREDLALLAADALGKLATPAAVAALQTGQQKGSSAVKQACAAALVTAARQTGSGKQSRPGAA